MICTVLQHSSLQEIEAALEQCEMAEIRLDRCPLSLEEISGLFTSDVPLVATCRLAEVLAQEPSLQELPEESRQVKACRIMETRLVAAIEAGARYVDVEMEVPKHVSKRIRQAAHENGTVFIRSFHDWKGTDSAAALYAVVENCRYHGADLVKLVTTAQNEEDVQRVMALYDQVRKENLLPEGGLIAFCMGEAGRQSRLDALAHGAPFTYAALEAGKEAAPGQWTTAELRRQLYGDFPFIGLHLQAPASKSFAQRAIVAAALAAGESHLTGYTPCADSEAAISFARSLGAEVLVNGDRVTVKGAGPGLGELQLDQVQVGESGLLARLAMPLLCQLNDRKFEVQGEKTLLSRKLAGVQEMLEAFGVKVSSSKPEEDGLTLPLALEGSLKNGRVDISGTNGSQLISGLLMALPLARKNTTFGVKDPKSIPYMFITLDVLRKFGIRVANDMLGGRDFLESGGDWSLCTEMVFKVRGGQRYRAADLAIEGDWSSAAAFLVAGAVFGQVEIEGLDTTSLQADLSIMDVLMDAGASLSQLDGDHGTVLVQRAPLQAFQLDATHCPDLFPIVAVLAAFCQGESRIAGLSRLVHKESDRSRSIAEVLEQLGVENRVEGDELVICGLSLARRLLTGRLLKGGKYTSCHDHRMAMALKVASLGADSPVEIDDMDCVAKSFPDFWSCFKK